MSNEIAITAFRPEHQPGIDSLLDDIQQEYPETIYGPASKKMIEVALMRGRKYWVALDQDLVIGAIGLVLLADNNACLKSMFLKKEYRGESRQIANALLMTALFYAKEQNAKQILLGTMMQFKAAQAFYIKHGFTPIPENKLPADFIKNPVDKVFFKLIL
jgi:N-acetylglutamate synthase-like GNAT family acetyltransferase